MPTIVLRDSYCSHFLALIYIHPSHSYFAMEWKDAHRYKLSSTCVNNATGMIGMMQVCVSASIVRVENIQPEQKQSFYVKACLFEICQQIIMTDVSIIISSSLA